MIIAYWCFQNRCLLKKYCRFVVVPAPAFDNVTTETSSHPSLPNSFKMGSISVLSFPLQKDLSVVIILYSKLTMLSPSDYYPYFPRLNPMIVSQ